MVVTKEKKVTNRLSAPILKDGKMYQDLHGQIAMMPDGT